MKYTTVKVCSHPRTGSHYITALLSVNFFNSDDYLKLYGGHLPWGMELQPKSEVRRNKQIGYVYITRNTDDVLNSIFVLRKRFGLKVDDKSTFLNTRYSKMWSPSACAPVTRTTLTGTTKHEDISHFFSGIQLKPSEYLKYHKKQWELKEPNLITIDYDKLLSNLDSTLDTVATFLGTKPPNNYQNIEQRIGWQLNQT